MGKTESKHLGTVPKTEYINRNDQSQAEIFKLKMDHFEEIFDWLSLRDLLRLSQTCKRMQRIVGYWIKTTYTTVSYELDGNIKILFLGEYNLDGLSLSIKKLWLSYLEFVTNHRIRQPQWWRKCRNISPKFNIPYIKADQFKSLTEILLKGVVLTEAGIERIKDVLGQLETVKIKYPSEGYDELYDEFLKHCTNVNRLCITGFSCNILMKTYNDKWLLRKFPKLEHFELLMFKRYKPIIELKTFFKQNKNIKTIATNFEMILENIRTFKKFKAKLDVLSVGFSFRNYHMAHNEFQLAGINLNDLYGRGLFKELHVYFFAPYRFELIDQEMVDMLISFNGLTKLYIEDMENGIDLSALINLKQLCINRTSNITNMGTLATKLINLEFIQFTDNAGMDDILPFVRYSTKLTKIVVENLHGFGFNIATKVEELNRARLELSNARKVIIYVREENYLDVKWAKNQTEWNLIEIKRDFSYDCITPFDYKDHSERTYTIF